MTSLSDVRTEIKNNLSLTGTVKDTTVDDCIRAAIRQFENRRYWFNLKTGTKTLSAGTNSVFVPSDFSMIESVDLIDSTTRWRDRHGFDFLEYTKLKADYFRDATLSTQRPRACALRNAELIFSHLADQAYTVEFTYYRRDNNEVASDTDVSVWFDREGRDAVRSLAQYLFESEHLRNPDVDASIPAFYKRQLDESHQRYEATARF